MKPTMDSLSQKRKEKKMEKNKRLFLSVSEEDLNKLDRLREELGMNRSEYIRYVIAGQKKIMPFSIKEKKLIEVLSAIELDINVIALKEEIKQEDVITVYLKMEEIKDLLDGKYNF